MQRVWGAFAAFLGGFALASSNPAYAQIGLGLDVSSIEASYIGTIGIASAGLGSFFWAPMSNVYGRRPVLIFSQAIGIAAGFGAAYAKSYSGILVGRFSLASVSPQATSSPSPSSPTYSASTSVEGCLDL
ncbi:hypothetical protein B0H19DRAFT_1262498 [Mycena capillaripes]|nr:hypothetical protein B0H19DRAFT_1262498 [Mycena capillaripes]